MCFSATASFLAGGALTTAGALTMKKARSRTEMPFASFPLLFGIQQTIEGIVWISFGSQAIHTVATYAYMLFSHVFWPFFFPISVLLLETKPIRKKILIALSLIGVTVGMYIFYFITTQPVSSEIINHSINYRSQYNFPLITMVLYILVTCGSCIVSSHRLVNVFGISLFLSFAVTTWFFNETFFSVWCFFGALLSLLVYMYFWDAGAVRWRVAMLRKRK